MTHKQETHVSSCYVYHDAMDVLQKKLLLLAFFIECDMLRN